MFDDIVSRIAAIASGSTFVWLCVVAATAGLSRGLTGFGAGMIFIPLASGLVGPQAAIGALWTMDGPSVIPMGLRSLKRAQFREIAIMFAAFLATTPLGLKLLLWLDPMTTRWIICLVILGAVSLLVAGWRYSGHPTPGLALATGIAAGILGGISGLPGPPIVMIWLAAAAANAHNVRDNINLFFLLTLAAYVVVLPWYGILTLDITLLGLVLAVPYTAMILVGTFIFNRLSDRNFRRIAYLVIAAAALLALPVLDKALGR